MKYQKVSNTNMKLIELISYSYLKSFKEKKNNKPESSDLMISFY